MSWLFGILNKQKQSKINFELEEEFQSVQNVKLFIAASKHSETTFLDFSQTGINAFVGIPIIERNNEKVILTTEQSLKFRQINIEELSGHFVWLTYSRDILNIYTDVFGLREVYYLDSENQFIFSTRIDLIKKHILKSNLNINEFSTLWLTNFQLSHNSILKGIKRLGPDGRITFHNNKLEIGNEKFSKTTIKNPAQKFSKVLLQYSKIKDENKNKISLALSGGIDARLILAYLMKSGNNFNCHTLINEENKDLKIADEICRTFNLNHQKIKRKNFDLAKSENEILQYYKYIPPQIPVTQILDFAIYGKKYLRNHILFDGGFGEFYRRQYLSKLFLRGSSKFNLSETENIKNILYASKPNIFDEEVNSQMVNSLNGFIKELISSFPEPKNKNELAEILDLISVNFMLPNVYGPGQIILDQNFISVMPLVQKETINSGMNIPLKQKKDSLLFKELIKQNNKKLSGINLVKNNSENPFWLNTKLVMLRLIIDRKIKKHKNFERYKIFYNSKEYILDLLNETNVKNNNYLSHSKNNKIAAQFFNGELSMGRYLDWLLTFILWNKANKI